MPRPKQRREWVNGWWSTSLRLPQETVLELLECLNLQPTSQLDLCKQALDQITCILGENYPKEQVLDNAPSPASRRGEIATALKSCVNTLNILNSLSFLAQKDIRAAKQTRKLNLGQDLEGSDICEGNHIQELLRQIPSDLEDLSQSMRIAQRNLDATESRQGKERHALRQTIAQLCKVFDRFFRDETEDANTNILKEEFVRKALQAVKNISIPKKIRPLFPSSN
ncbi:MAG: hypothetical protein NPIRA02_40200 [Nitrospirales bacterium]|nr:MAG: hypothetical protein NPIRA02_40200 [Nitrospirales bacterium]